MRHPKALLALSLLLGTASCQKWPGSIERLQQTCGTDVDSSRYRYIQAVDPEGRALDDKTLLAARYRTDQGLEDLPVSQQGCVGLPLSSGQLEMASQNPALGLVQKIDWTDAPGFQTLALQAAPMPEVSLECPSEGLFAADQLALKSQILVDQKSSSKLYRWELLADSQLLASRTFGEASLQLTENLRTGNLEERRYQLQLRVVALIDDFKEQPAAQVKACALTVQRHIPKVINLANDTFVAAAPESVLPLQAEAGSQLYVCREPNLDQSELRGACNRQAPGYCQDAAHYSLTTTLATEKLGYSRYYLRAKNQAGLWSETTCLEVAVDRSPPRMKLAFDDDKLNRPGSGPDLPYRDYRAQVVQLEDDATDTAYLEQQLECRLDFINTRNALSSSEATFCRSTRCQGQSLDDWKPCDRLLSWYSGDDWERMINSSMNLRVRTRDRLNRVTEETLSLWMLDSRFKNAWPRNEVWFGRQFDLNQTALRNLSIEGDWQAVAGTPDDLWLAPRTGFSPVIARIVQTIDPATQKFTTSTTLYDSNNTALPSDSRVTELLVDRDQRLWVGLNGTHGFARWNEVAKNFDLITKVSGEKVLDFEDSPLRMVQDRDGAVWCKLEKSRVARIAGDVIDVFDSQDITGIEMSSPPPMSAQMGSAIEDVLLGPRLDAAGQVWFGRAGPEVMLIKSLEQGWERHLIEEMSNDTGWLADFQWDGEQFILANEKGEFATYRDLRYKPLPRTGKNVPPTEILPLPGGAILVASANGLYKTDGVSGWVDMSVANKVFDVADSGLRYPHWNYLRQLGNSGEIWYTMQSVSPKLSTNSYAVSRTGKDQMYFNSGNSNIPNALSTQVLEDRQGRLWLGTQSGLSVLVKDRWKIPVTSDETLRRMNVEQIVEDQEGHIWVLFGKVGEPSVLALVQDFRLININERLPPDMRVLRLAADLEGQVLLAAGAQGLWRLQAQGAAAVKIPAEGHIDTIVSAADGTLLAVVDQQLKRLTPNGWTTVGDPRNLAWTRIYPGPKGQIFAGRKDELYELQDQTWTRVGAGEEFSAVAFDTKGEPWFDAPRKIWHQVDGQWHSYLKDDLRSQDTPPNKKPLRFSHISTDRYGRILTGTAGPGTGFLILTP